MTTTSQLLKTGFRVAIIIALIYVAVVILVYLFQRSLLYIPGHQSAPDGLPPWSYNGQIMGCCHEVPNPKAAWLMLHGNAGQAADRDYVLERMAPDQSLYVMEYPGYGTREGSPSMDSINKAASEAYRAVRAMHPDLAVCVIGESIGTGPACTLAGEPTPPDKITLIVPFDTLVNVAAKHYPFLPVRMLLRDRWDNVKSLKGYNGPVEIYGAAYDSIIPIQRARALAKQVPNAVFIELDCGHNEWADSSKVRIER